MSDEESDYYSSNSESDEEEAGENVENIVLSKKQKPATYNHAKQFSGYEEESDQDEDSDSDEDSIEDDMQEGGEKKEESEDDEDDGEPDDEDDEESDIEIDQEGEAVEKKSSKTKKITQLIVEDDEEDDDEDGYEENYLQKFDSEINKNYIHDFHPECLNHNSDEIEKLARLIRDENNIVDDPLHRTLPYLTKYEKARVLGQRAKQIEIGSKPFVKVPENVIDGYVIAQLELKQKRIPFIIRRPLPNGGSEYWKLQDLEDISF